MKRNFLTGLVILLPFALTLWILAFLINILTFPFVGIVESISNIDFENLPLTARSFFLFMAKIIILLFLTAFIFLVGYLGQHFIVRSLFYYGDRLVHRIPFVNSIYKSTQEVVKTLFQQDHTTFSQVVLVPFPHEKTRSIGFITKSDQASHLETVPGNLVSVFVPGTPNPTMGFMLLYEKDKVIFTKMSVEEAIKFVISCGVMSGPFNSK